MPQRSIGLTTVEYLEALEQAKTIASIQKERSLGDIFQSVLQTRLVGKRIFDKERSGQAGHTMQPPNQPPSRALGQGGAGGDGGGGGGDDDPIDDPQDEDDDEEDSEYETETTVMVV